MRIIRKLSLGTIFFVGALTGIIIINLGKSVFLENTGILDEYTLYHMKYMTVDGGALFYYVLWLRLKNVAMLVVLATTYLGLVVCIGTSFWYGFSIGGYLSVLLMRYGLKGLVFALLGIFPQGLLYVPAMAALIAWCMKLNRSIYYQKGMGLEGDRGLSVSKRVLQLVAILVIMLLGCLAESFINPGIMAWLLNFF